MAASDQALDMINAALGVAPPAPQPAAGGGDATAPAAAASSSPLNNAPPAAPPAPSDVALDMIGQALDGKLEAPKPAQEPAPSGGGLRIVIHPKGYVPPPNMTEGNEGLVSEPSPNAPPAPQLPKLSGFLPNVGAGASSAIAGTLGAPVDATAWALNKGISGLNAATGADVPQITAPVGGSDFFKTLMGTVGADPRNVEQKHDFDALGNAIGSGVGSMLMPFGTARTALAAFPQATGLTRQLLETLGAGSLKSASAVGAGGGAGGYIGEQNAPPALQPLAKLGGSLLGGGLVGGVAAAGQGVGRAASDLASSYVAPFGYGAKEALGQGAEGQPLAATMAQQRLAGQRILNQSSAPSTLLSDLEDATTHGPALPGDQPTTFQLRPTDTGLGQLERQQQTKAPAVFNQRRADQNSARTQALDSLAPDADPAAVGRFFRGQLDAITADHDAAVQAAQSGAQRATSAIGGTRFAGTASPHQAYGEAIREQVQTAENAAKARASALWKAVDPEGRLVLASAPLKRGAAAIRAEVDPASGAALTAREEQLIGAAERLPVAARFSTLRQMRTEVGNYVRELRAQPGSEQAARRMVLLRNAIDDALEQGAAQQAGREQSAVAAGRMRPEGTTAARLAEQTRQGAPAAAPVVGRVIDVPRQVTVGGTAHEIVFPDANQAAVFDLGLALRRGGRRAAVDAEAKRLLEVFKGHVEDIETPSDVKALARDYIAQVEDSIAHRAPGRHEAVSLIDPEQAEAYLRARVLPEVARTGDLGLGRLVDEASQWQIPSSEQRAEQSAQATAGGNAGARPEAGPDQGSAAGRVSSAPRGQVSPGRGPRDAAGGPGVQSQPFDAAAAQRYAAARAATLDQKQRFSRGAPGTVLAPGARGAQYRLPASQVAETFFNSGRRAAEDIQSFEAAVGGHSEGMRLLEDYAAFSLRRAAEKPDGTPRPPQVRVLDRSAPDGAARLSGARAEVPGRRAGAAHARERRHRTPGGGAADQG